MTEYNEYDFTGEDAGIYDFSWENVTESLAAGELANLNNMMFNVANLVEHMCYNSDYSNTSVAFADLRDKEIGRNSWIQEYYYANQGTFEKCMKGDKPSWYHELSLDKQKTFDLALSYQKDASQLVKPLDQMMLLMFKVPLLDSYRVVRLTMTLDDMGFDDEYWEKINTDLIAVSDMLNKTDSALEMSCKQYYKENHGKVSNNDLLDGYRIARRKDYITSFKAFCARAQDSFRVNEAGHFSVDLNAVLLVRTLDQYTSKVAEALKENIQSTLEGCLDECSKLDAVLKSRDEKLETDLFRTTITALDTLNTAIKDYCDLALTVYKRYKDGDNDAPFVFMKKPSANSSIRPKYGFEPVTNDPLDNGSRYEKMYVSAANALTQHCLEFSQYTGNL